MHIEGVFPWLLGLSIILAAQVPAWQPPSAPTKNTSISVTGCLQRSQTEEYHLTSSEGKRYVLRTNNSEIRLADYVGKEVTATGAKPMAPNTPPTATKVDPQGFLDIVAIVVLKPTCQP